MAASLGVGDARSRKFVLRARVQRAIDARCFRVGESASDYIARLVAVDQGLPVEDVLLGGAFRPPKGSWTSVNERDATRL